MIKNLGPAGREAKFYLHTENLRYEGAPDRHGLTLLPLSAPIFVGGKNDGKPIEDGQMPVNSVVLVSFGHTEVRKGFVRLITNPALNETATVSAPVLLAADKISHPINVYIRAHKGTDLNLDWLLRLYVED